MTPSPRNPDRPQDAGDDTISGYWLALLRKLWRQR